jgi:hypothetical protein
MKDGSKICKFKKQVLKAELEAQQRNNAQMRAHLERFALMRDELEQGANRSESHLVLWIRIQHFK